MHSLSYLTLDIVACDCIAYSYVPAFSLHCTQHDWDGCYHLAGHYIIIYSEGFAHGMLACGIFVYYLAASVGALCTLMMYQSHGSTGYLMSYAWIVLRMALNIW